MARGPIFLVAIALLAACGPGASSPAPSPSTSAAAAPATSVKAGAFTDCPVTRPVTNERPKNSNTAAFSSAWYVSPDRLLWASAGYRLWAGRTGNKVLWERPGTAVSISGKLLNGDAKAAGVPTISGPSGYETQDYQASGVTFPVGGCWLVEARAASSVLEFVALVYPHEYAPAAKSCIDLKRTFDNSDAVLQASAIAVADDLPGFALVRLSPKIAYKPPSGLDGTIELHIDLDEIARPHAGDGYVLFLTRNDPGSWQIVCPFRTLATVDGAGIVRSASLRATDLAPLLPADVRELDAALRALAR